MTVQEVKESIKNQTEQPKSEQQSILNIFSEFSLFSSLYGNIEELFENYKSEI